MRRSGRISSSSLSSASSPDELLNDLVAPEEDEDTSTSTTNLFFLQELGLTTTGPGLVYFMCFLYVGLFQVCKTLLHSYRTRGEGQGGVQLQVESDCSLPGGRPSKDIGGSSSSRSGVAQNKNEEEDTSKTSSKDPSNKTERDLEDVLDVGSVVKNPTPAPAVKNLITTSPALE
ncbi:unnamed protein product [Amoebophrya sp. A25]|nr:unnamed protein product [Amoebophrya sp. A25]|eukprot:GSA25T00026245001.1